MGSINPSTKEILLQATAQELGPEALDTVELSSIPKAPSAPGKLMPTVPTCITQDPIPQNLRHDPAAIMVGMKNNVPRWKLGSVVKWSAWQMGYDSPGDANYAAAHCYLAAQKWNEADVGVTFEYTPLAKDANFVLSYGGLRAGVLASAYFPNDNDMNFVYVYEDVFGPEWKPYIWKVLTHELGHVLGLRHEFAMDPDPNKFEGNAVRIGKPNELSVMNYRPEPPEIQPSDITETREFYQMPAGKMLGRTPIVDFVPM